MNVAAYCRVSTDKIAQKSSEKNQVDIYTQRIKENPDWVFVGIYADPEFSGTSGNRPQFQRMIRDAEAGKIDYILTKSISRFARNTLLTIETLRHFKELGVGVFFEKEHLDTSTPYSEVVLTIFAAFAQEESRITSERIKKGLEMRAKNGNVGWRPLYGYRKDYEIVEKEAEVVRRIFTEYEEGRTMLQIANGLNEDCILSTRGTTWSSSRVWCVLKNERYCGDVLTNKRFTPDHLTHKTQVNKGEVKQYLLENHHPGIITHRQFDAVQEMIKMASEPKKRGPKIGPYVCPYCDRKLIEHRKDSTRGWRCECGQFYIPVKHVEEALRMAAEQAGKEEKPSNMNFGFHQSKEDRTLTACWADGTEVTVPTNYKFLKAALALQNQGRKTETHHLPASRESTNRDDAVVDRWR